MNDTRRFIGAAEFVLGATIVLGHNVWHVVPNEVIVLFVAAMISIRVRGGGLASLGLIRPDSWTRVLLIALAAAVLRIILGDLLIIPIAERFWPAPETSSVIQDATGSLGDALMTLVLVWTFAAFGEEIVYRGYLFSRLCDALTGGRADDCKRDTHRLPTISIALFITSVLFGFGHYYKGTAGICDSTVAGLIFGCAYWFGGRTLWTAIFAHGFIDTIAVVATYFGWAD